MGCGRYLLSPYEKFRWETQLADEKDILIREIDEELKQENLQKIWKQYGSMIIGGSLFLVASVAAFKGWQTHQLNSRIALGESFSAAQLLAISKNKDAAKERFDSILKESTGGYRMLAKFQLASLALKKSNWDSAITIYKNIVNDENVNLVYRDLATILGALAELESKRGNVEFVERANQLAVSSSPLRFSAKEISALSAFINGNLKIAQRRYSEISKEAAAPPGLRNRAQNMLDLLAN